MPSPRQPSESPPQESGSAGPAAPLEDEGSAQRASPHSTPYSSLASVITVLFLMLALFAPAQLHAENIAESTDFTTDTRDYGGSEVAQSGDFTVDTTTESSSGPTESVIFALDTRAPSPDLASSQSALFTVNTRLGHGADAFILSGTVKTSTGRSLGGCSASLLRLGTVVETTLTTNSGNYLFPAVPAETYHLRVAAPGYIPVFVSINGITGSNQTRHLTLTPLSQPPLAGEKGHAPTNSEVNPKAVSVSAHLKVYGGGGWNGTVNCHWPTVILTHGWKSSSAGWPFTMALEMSLRLNHPNLNILAWDWEQEAASANGQIVPSDKTPNQGTQLGQALYEALHPDYDQRIHFIGHSLGALVNRYACDYLHAGSNPRWSATLNQPHISLLDEAELASVQGATVITTALTVAQQGLVQAAGELSWKDLVNPVGAGLSLEAKITLETLNATIGKAIEDWKSPVPRQYAYIDNYVSFVGGTLDDAANVCLAAPPEDLVTLIGAHAYAYRWYQDSMGFLGTVPMGFSRAAEADAILPPTDPAFQAGTIWLQASGLNRNPMQLTRVTESFKGECTLYWFLNLTAAPNRIVVNDAKEIAQFAGGVAQTMGQAYKTAVVDMSQLTITEVKKWGNVIAESALKAGQFINATTDTAWNPTTNLTSDLSLNAALIGSTLRFIMKPDGSDQSNAVFSRSSGNNSGPGLWITLRVPENAGLMAFDFTVHGELADDCIVAAVAGENIFHLPAKYLTADLKQSSDLLDISEHAGQEVEFFFGLSGGTAEASAEAVIEGIRFVTIPQPTLAIENHGATVSLHWPSAASGWTLEASPSLASGSWQEVLPNPGALTVADGVMRLEEAKTSARQFYRLRRIP